MTASAAPGPRPGAREANWRHGIQLAAAVVVSYLLSSALGLPEGLWAVMSSLIVMRPTTGSTLGAGWERLRGTLAGTLFGLGGIWLHHLGVAMPLATLGIVALLALSSAWFPAMRSAPITALIVLSSAGIAGQPAFRVAGLRVAEITIGVLTGLAISLIGLRSRARTRFDTATAAALRHIAADVRCSLAKAPPAPEQKEEMSTALRLELRELAVLAVSADREARLWRSRQQSRWGGGDECTRTARLMVRISHDVAVFPRLAESGPLAREDAAWSALAAAAGEALDDAANCLETQDTPEFQALRRFCAFGGLEAAAPANSPRSPIPWAAPMARLLLRDLTGLARRADGEAN